jgi:CheY-like chemotaxis protein
MKSGVIAADLSAAAASSSSSEEQDENQKPTAPPEGLEPFTQLDVPFEMPERAFFQQLDERARRVELMSALLRAGGLPPEHAVNALQAALAAIVTSANDATLPTLANLASALRVAIGHLGIGRPIADDERVVDTLVLDESELSRDLVALAVEAQGHPVRCAATYDDLVREISQRKPGLVITEVQITNAPAAHFCGTLQEILSQSHVPYVFFSDLDSGALSDLATKFGAKRSISKEFGIDLLIGELRDVYRQILDIRRTGGRKPFKTTKI